MRLNCTGQRADMASIGPAAAARSGTALDGRWWRLASPSPADQAMPDTQSAGRTHNRGTKHACNSRYEQAHREGRRQARHAHPAATPLASLTSPHPLDVPFAAAYAARQGADIATYRTGAPNGVICTRYSGGARSRGGANSRRSEIIRTNNKVALVTLRNYKEC
jgi:hypothetical protein